MIPPAARESGKGSYIVELLLEEDDVHESCVRQAPTPGPTCCPKEVQAPLHFQVSRPTFLTVILKGL